MKIRSKKFSPDDYIVGYKRPPEKNRFQKGASGNPSGRPRKKPSLTDRIRKELLSRQTVNVGGQRLSLTTEDVLIKSIIQNAIRGKNVKAMDVVLGWISSLDATKAPETQSSFPEITREALAKMTPEEQTQLYRRTLAEMNRKAFDSDT